MSKIDTQVKYLIHQSNLIEGYDDPRFDEQGLIAWRHLLSIGSLRELHHYDIKRVQRDVVYYQTDLKDEWHGEYRKVDVFVGGQPVKEPAHLERYMTNWIAELTFTDPIAAHIVFEQIHPFADGNGRTGRLLLWWHQHIKGEPLTEITYFKRDSYFGWFK